MKTLDYGNVLLLCAICGKRITVQLEPVGYTRCVHCDVTQGATGWMAYLDHTKQFCTVQGVRQIQSHHTFRLNEETK